MQGELTASKSSHRATLDTRLYVNFVFCARNAAFMVQDDTDPVGQLEPRSATWTRNLKR
jgi:hypothetical protein